MPLTSLKPGAVLGKHTILDVNCIEKGLLELTKVIFPSYYGRSKIQFFNIFLC